MQELNAQPRELTGKKVKTLRQKGLLPVVLYGYQTPATPLIIQTKDFENVWKRAGESSLILLKTGTGEYNVLIHDVTRDPIRGSFLHADFNAVRMDQKIRASVPIEFTGESPAAKNEGGILIKVRQELEVEALPKNLPKECVADLSLLSVIDSRLYIKDIALPEGVKILADLDAVVALVEKARSEEELAALEQAPEETVAEVKTEKEAKAEKEAKETPMEEKQETPEKKQK